MSESTIERLALIEPDWADVERRAGLTSARWPWRPVLVAAVLVAAVVGVGVAIAAGVGAFNGISAAQRPQTPADRIDPTLFAEINTARQSAGPGAELLADSSRLIRRLPGGARLYTAATKDGELCVLGVGVVRGAATMGCGPPLPTQSEPITLSSFANRGTPINWGLALDHITAVTFQLGGREKTVPVKNNAWAYEGPSPRIAQSIVIHYDDGSTRSFTP